MSKWYVVLLMAGIENAIQCNTESDALELYETLSAAGYMCSVEKRTTYKSVIYGMAD